MITRTLWMVSMLWLGAVAGWAQQPDEADRKAILAIMDNQTQAWNTGNLDAFMEGYWRSDSLKFIGSQGISYGWQAALDNYKKSYPNVEAMGKLSFNILHVEFITPTCYFVVGKWHLKRKKGDLSGHYTLLWKKIDGQWVIVVDHSS